MTPAPYIDSIAHWICREAGDGDMAKDEYLPLFRIYAVLALSRGGSTNACDVHNAWSAWRAATMPDHRSLVPFDDLSQEVQDLDIPYVSAIRTVATRLTIR